MNQQSKKQGANTGFNVVRIPEAEFLELMASHQLQAEPFQVRDGIHSVHFSRDEPDGFSFGCIVTRLPDGLYRVNCAHFKSQIIVSSTQTTDSDLKNIVDEVVKDFEQYVLGMRHLKSIADGINAQAQAVRCKALADLQHARSLDHKNPYSITHRHNYGQTTYILWSVDEPTEEEAIKLLHSEYEPDKDESLTIEMLTLEELLGVPAN